MRFELVDRVVEREADRIVTVKAVTSAEEYLADHFPSFPVLPGVMMLESLVQAARVLIADRHDAPWVVAEVRNVRYGNMVRPGEQLQVSVERTKSDEATQTFKGVGEVNGNVAVQGKFMLRRANDK
jgi:3-hydroxyacyl-[acyl-carrier-protein] dehydratase